MSKKDTLYDPTHDMDLLELTPFEQSLEDDFENSAPVENYEEVKAMLIEAAKNYQKSKMISIRVQTDDLAEIKEKAKDIWIPYQKLIKLLIHLYTKGKICLPEVNWKLIIEN